MCDKLNKSSFKWHWGATIKTNKQRISLRPKVNRPVQFPVLLCWLFRIMCFVPSIRNISFYFLRSKNDQSIAHAERQREKERDTHWLNICTWYNEIIWQWPKPAATLLNTEPCTFFVAAFNDHIEFQCKCSHFWSSSLASRFRSFECSERSKKKTVAFMTLHFSLVACECETLRKESTLIEWTARKKDTLTRLMCVQRL